MVKHGKTISWTTTGNGLNPSDLWWWLGDGLLLVYPPFFAFDQFGMIREVSDLVVPTAPSTKNEFWKVATGPKFRCCCHQPWYDGLCRWENSWHCMQSNLALENTSMPIYAHLVRLATFDDTGVYDCWKHPNKGASLWSTSSLSADMSDNSEENEMC